VAVIGSIAASLYLSRLTATLPAGLPAPAVTAARGSVGGAIIAVRQVSKAGFAPLAHRLGDAAVLAFLHGFAGGCLTAAGVAASGALLAGFLLPARPELRQGEVHLLPGSDTQPASAAPSNPDAGSRPR
jgi:MFS transporter, DHA2 family, multidrug resistance protein